MCTNEKAKQTFLEHLPEPVPVPVQHCIVMSLWEIPIRKRFNEWRSNSTFNQNGNSSEHMSLSQTPLEL